MQIRIIAVGKIKESYIREGIGEYEKRLRPYLKVSISEIAEEKRGVSVSLSQEKHLRELEGVRILDAIPPEALVIALDVGGQHWSSEQFAKNIGEWEIAGKSPVVFIIGGDLGLGENVLTRASLRLSLSPMTFTHPVARFILLEQIYRAYRILRGEPYHK